MNLRKEQLEAFDKSLEEYAALAESTDYRVILTKPNEVVEIKTTNKQPLHFNPMTRVFEQR